MGNAQSTTTPREQNRLTKPRTNISKNPSGTQLSVVTAFGKTISNPQPCSSAAFEISPNERLLTQQFYNDERGIYDGYQNQSQTSAYRSSFRRDSVNCSLDQVPEPADFNPKLYSDAPYGPRTSTVASRHRSKRLSSTFPSTSRLSLAMPARYPDFQDVDEQLDILEGDAPAEDETIFDRTVFPDSEREFRDNLKPLPCPDTCVGVRRRSLAITPGMATRNPIPSVSQELAIRKEKARLSVPEAPSWMREKILPSPPVYTLAPPNYLNNAPITRAETPADLDYTHLGTLKLGSLVLTNGHASPDPNSMIEKRNYVGSDRENVDPKTTPADSLSVSMSQKLLHRKTWSAGMLDLSSTAQALDNSTDPGAKNAPYTEDDQRHINFSMDEAKENGSTLQDGSTGFGSSSPPIVDSRETEMSPRTMVHRNREEIASSIHNAGLHNIGQKLNDDEVDISEEEAKSFRNEALRILECTTSTPEQQKQSSGEFSSRPSTISESSSKKPIEPIQVKPDSGYCSEYSMATFSRDSSAKSCESRNTEESVVLSPACQSLDKPKKVDLLRDLAAERARQQTALPNIAVRRKSSGFLRLRAKSSREIASSSQTSTNQPNLETQTEQLLKTTRSTEPSLGPRKLQKKNPALHQSFVIVSNTGRSPLSSSNSSVDNLPRLPQKYVKKSQQSTLPEKNNSKDGEKITSKRERSFSRRSFLRSKSTTNLDESRLDQFSNSHTEIVSNTDFSERLERKKSLGLRSKSSQQQSQREIANLSKSQSRVAPDNADHLSRSPTYTCSIRSVQPEKVPSRSRSATEIKPILASDPVTSPPRPNLQLRSLSVQTLLANDAENSTSSETRDHRFALDVPPVPSIPVLSNQNPSSPGLSLRNEGPFVAKVAQQVTPLIVSSDQGAAGHKGLVAKRSRDELAKFIARVSKEPPSPSKRRFYKEVREHQDECRQSLGDGSAVDRRGLRSRKSLGSVSDKWHGRSNHPDLPIPLYA